MQSRVTGVDPHLDIDTYDPSADLMVLNLGPQHPSTHGVFRVKLYLDGEIIVKAIPYAGYLHRGVEKLCEELTFVQVIPIVDKNDYVAPMMNEQAHQRWAVEALLGVEVPRRARYMRSILGGAAATWPLICCGSAPSPSTWAARSAAARRCSSTASASARLILDLLRRR